MAEQKQSQFRIKSWILLNQKHNLHLKDCISILLIILTLQMLPIAQASANFQSSRSQELQTHLKSFTISHTRQIGLEFMESHEKKALRKPNESEFYLFNSVEYVQICFSEYDPNYVTLPYFLKFRSYRPIQKINLSGVRCYQIFNKLELLEKSDRSQKNEAQTRKVGKQIQYLINQYQLIDWIHNLGLAVNSALDQAKNQQKLLLSSLDVFALHFYRGADSISLVNVWTKRKGTQIGYKIVKKLDGKGLHRKVTYQIQLNDRQNVGINDINSQQCEVRIVQTLPHKMYIDVDELNSQGVSIKLEEGNYGDGISFINIEKPAYQSRQYQYQFKTSWGAWTHTKIDEFSFELPVHFRYPSPFKVNQEKTIEYVEEELYPITFGNVVCNSTGEQQFYRLEEDYLIGKGTAFLPVGDSLMKSVVSIVTLGSQVMCAILLVKQLRK